jgi:adenylate cyclase
MEKDQVKRELAGILHADVVGSTSLVQKDEQLAHHRIQDAFRRFGDTITKYHGRVRELRGDALLADFERASDAISAAVVFQAENVESNATVEDDIQPQLRVGISLGEVVIADGTVTGAGVVLAQRVEQLADAGRICITGAIHEAVPRHLPVSYTDLGRREMKGFEDPVQVYQASVNTNGQIPPAEPARPQRLQFPSKVRRLPIMWVLAALVAFIGAIVMWQSRTPVSKPDTPAIAVLAFDNLSGDPKQEYLSDGISESIITALSHVPGILVIARQSAFSYKGKSLKVEQIAQELGVHYVLQGSVQRSDTQIRVTAQLVDATDGHQLWAQQYDRQWKDIFKLQDNITQHIIANISSNEGPLLEAILERVKQKAPTDLRAYDYLLLGREHLLLVTEEDNARARKLFQKSLEVDPNYSLGHAWLAWTYHLDVSFGWSKESTLLIEKALHHAQKAVELDNTEAGAHWVLAAVLAYIGEQPEVALAEYEKALSLNPNNADILADYGWSIANLGRAGEGVDFVKKAIRLNPVHPDWYGEGLMHALYVDRRYHEVIDVAHTITIRTLPNYLDLAGSYAQLGQLDAAQETAARILDLEPDFSIGWWRGRTKFTDPADLDHYLDGLYKAGLPE